MANPNLIKGTHHINLQPCGQEAYEKTVAFYAQVLGMPVVRTWGEGEGRGCMIDTGDSVMEINCVTKEGLKEPGPVNHFALTTDHVDEVTELVRQAGYPITIEPRDVVLPSDPPYDIRIAFCVGPVGESIEFFCVK